MFTSQPETSVRDQSPCVMHITSLADASGCEIKTMAGVRIGHGMPAEASTTNGLTIHPSNHSPNQTRLQPVREQIDIPFLESTINDVAKRDPLRSFAAAASQNCRLNGWKYQPSPSRHQTAVGHATELRHRSPENIEAVPAHESC
jgi:hypothetical protein